MNILLLFLCHLSACLLQARATEDPTPLAPRPPPQYDEEVDNGSLGYYPTKSFVTQEDVEAPAINFVKWSPQCDDGLFYFITPRGWSLTRPGPMILDSRGEMIWGHHFDNSFGGQAYDFMVQTYQGQNYLTFWLGDDRVRGHGSGSYYMLNASYDIVHKINGANGLDADLHEFVITKDDTALMSIYEVTHGDVTQYRTFDDKEIAPNDQNFIWDCLFQEVDIRTGELLFQWRASEHVQINETYRDIYDGGHQGDPWDWYHINSIDKDEEGNYLISARYPHSIMYIHGGTGETIWQLGGKKNDFLDLSKGDSLNFAWQHDARFFPVDTFPNIYTPPKKRDGYTTKLMTVFDNAAEDQHYQYGVEVSRGLLLEVTYPTPGTSKAKAKKEKIVSDPRDPPNPEGEQEPDWNMLKVLDINATDPDWTVRVIQSYDNPAGFRSSSQGSMQILPQEHGDPKVFVGYGLNAVWAEFAPDGTVLCDVHFGAKTSWERGDIQSYRAYKQAWTGRPEWPPSVEISDDLAEVYVSWNGATDVVDWVLQCSQKSAYDDAAWGDVIKVPKQGFQTTISVPKSIGDIRYLRIMALAENGRRLEYGTSKPIDRGVLAAYWPSLNKQLPHQVARLTPTKVFLVIVLNVSFLFICYECYRRYLSWRIGRPGAGPLRWRKGPAARLLGDM